MIKRFIFLAAVAPIGVMAQTPAITASTAPSALPIDRVVAIVGDQTVLWSDVLTAINQRRAQGLQLPPDSAGQAALARQVLGELVDEEMLVQKAKEMKLEVTDAARSVLGRTSEQRWCDHDVPMRREILDHGITALVPERLRGDGFLVAFTERTGGASGGRFASLNLGFVIFCRLSNRSRWLSAVAPICRNVLRPSPSDRSSSPRTPRRRPRQRQRLAPTHCSPKSERVATSSRSRSASRWIPVRSNLEATSAGTAAAVDLFRSSKE